MVLLIKFEISHRAVVHGVFEVILGHESGDKLSQILFFNTHFVRDVGNHESSHFFSID